MVYAGLLISPVTYRAHRMAEILGAGILWSGALFVWWPRARIRTIVIGSAVVAVFFIALPGRPAGGPALRADYQRALNLYGHARYVWGGENALGIDCSGLVRKGLVWGQIFNGIRTLNGTPIRAGISLWWNDGTAKNMRDGYRGLTRQMGTAKSINEADYTQLLPGDLAVTSDGIHVMVYRYNRTWIEADPDLRRVVEITIPSKNYWFTIPVVLVRWRVFDE